MTRRAVDLPQPPGLDRKVEAVERHVRLGALAAGERHRQVVEADVPAHGATTSARRRRTGAVAG